VPLRLRIIFAASSNSVVHHGFPSALCQLGHRSHGTALRLESDWSSHMLNPWLAITFHAIRLGFEAQNAVALRMMRMVGDVSKTAAGGMIANKAPAPADAQKAAKKAAKKVATRSGASREASTKSIKRMRAKRRRHSNN
jgi:hypothetical protein